MERKRIDKMLVSDDGESTTERWGVIARVRGSVIDVRFSCRVPDLHNELTAGDDREVIIEVVNHLDAQALRGIALTPTEGLARGSAVEDRGRPLRVHESTEQNR